MILNLCHPIVFWVPYHRWCCMPSFIHNTSLMWNTSIITAPIFLVLSAKVCRSNGVGATHQLPLGQHQSNFLPLSTSCWFAKSQTVWLFSIESEARWIWMYIGQMITIQKIEPIILISHKCRHLHWQRGHMYLSYVLRLYHIPCLNWCSGWCTHAIWWAQPSMCSAVCHSVSPVAPLPTLLVDVANLQPLVFHQYWTLYLLQPTPLCCSLSVPHGSPGFAD